MKKPSWAKYKARNKDGFEYYFAYQPKPSNTGWVAAGIKGRINLKDTKPFKHENWHNTLEIL